MYDDLIDDEVRASFPGWTDIEIHDWYVAVKSEQEKRDTPSIYESDISHARIIRELGWDAFKEYLVSVTGTDVLEPDDFVALADASSFLRELENTSLYMAIYGAASEMHSKKTASARNDSYKKLTSTISKIEIAKGI